MNSIQKRYIEIRDTALLRKLQTLLKEALIDLEVYNASRLFDSLGENTDEKDALEGMRKTVAFLIENFKSLNQNLNNACYYSPKLHAQMVKLMDEELKRIQDERKEDNTKVPGRD